MKKKYVILIVIGMIIMSIYNIKSCLNEAEQAAIPVTDSTFATWTPEIQKQDINKRLNRDNFEIESQLINMLVSQLRYDPAASEVKESKFTIIDVPKQMVRYQCDLYCKNGFGVLVKNNARVDFQMRRDTTILQSMSIKPY